MLDLVKSGFCNNSKGQSAVELAIFGSILIFVISLIFRQALSGGNFMRVQLQATRYAMSKSLEMSERSVEKPGRNTASTMVIEDRLSGDFGNRFGSRDRVPLIASGSATFSNQLFYPVDSADWGERDVLPYFDVWVNGQRFSFTTANFVTHSLPTDGSGLKKCSVPHKEDSRCLDDSGNVVLHKVVQNYPGSGFDLGSPEKFDVNFDGVTIVPGSLKNSADATKMGFMWQWQNVTAVGELPTGDPIDVDGDFQEEQILSSTVDPDTNRTASVSVIDRQAGDLDFTIDDRRPNDQVGLLSDSQMFSFTNDGTTYRVQDGKLFDMSTSRYIRNTNINDHVDVVQRVFQLSNDTGRFCNGDTPRTSATGWDGQPPLNPVAACNKCFSGTKIQVTCFDTTSRKLYIRSRIDNRSRRSWLTRTEP